MRMMTLLWIDLPRTTDRRHADDIVRARNPRQSQEGNEEMLPVRRRLFTQVRQGIADGIHVDDYGNVWTGEYEGAVVRNAAGKTIGVFNSQYFQADKDAGTQLAFVNFALADDVLVFLSETRLWTVKLAKTVVSRDSPIVN